MAEKATDQQEFIRETVKQLIQEMSPIFSSIALTPDKLREAQKPYEDPVKLARQLHEQQSWRKQEEEKNAAKKNLQNGCSHKGRNGKWNISLQHNYHDHMPRGLCNVCGIFIHPQYWDFRPITHSATAARESYVEDKGFIIPEHPLYHVVRQLESYS